MCVLQFYHDFSKNDYRCLLMLFSNHLWPNIWTLSTVTPSHTVTAGSCPWASNSSRHFSLPFWLKTSQRCSVETKTAGQLFTQPFPSLLPRGKAQKTRTIPTCPLSLCWPPVGSVVETELQPSSGAFPGPPQHQNWWQRTILEHSGPAWWGKSSRYPQVPQLLHVFHSQSNICLQQCFSQNIYFVHCNLSKEPCIIFTVYAILFAYPAIQISGALCYLHNIKPVVLQLCSLF